MRSATASISELADCSGLELVARLADGSIQRPPMAETLPFTLLPPKEGNVELLAAPEPRFCNLTNTVHGGWIMTMLDTAMALAAQTTLSPGETCPSHKTTAKFARHRPCALARPDSHHARGKDRGRPRQTPRAWHVDMPGREQETVMSPLPIANSQPSERHLTGEVLFLLAGLAALGALATNIILLPFRGLAPASEFLPRNLA